MLCSLSPEAASLLTPAFCEGQVVRFSKAVIEPYLEESKINFDSEALESAVDRVVSETEKFSPTIDPLAARAIHQVLSLTRREAAHPGFWRYLAIALRPELVRHRWEARSFATTRQRYWSTGTRHTSNTFCRLWWIAELTVRDHDYTLTDKALGNLAIPLFVRRLSHFPIAVEVLVEELHEASSTELEGFMKQFGRVLSTLVLEGMDKDELRNWVRRVRRGLK